jgi:hypothetical protein
MSAVRSHGRLLAGLVALGAGVLMTATAHASPFKITGMDAASEFEVKLEGEATVSESETEIEAPVLDVTFPIRPGLETSVTFGRGSLKEGPDPAREGWLDTEWAVKWEVVPFREDGAGVAVTTEPALIAPTGSAGLSDGRWRVEVPVIVGKDIGPIGLRGLVGYAHAFGGGGETQFGVLATYRLSDKVKVGAEIVGAMPDLNTREYETLFDVGAVWEFMPGVELQGRIGRTIREAPGDEPATNFALFIEKAF